MERYQKDFLKELRAKRKSYADMVDFCCDNIILNNYIYDKLSESGIYFDTFCGTLEHYYNESGEEISEEAYNNNENAYRKEDEVFQYYIISEHDAERLADYTNEIVLYNEQLELYILCVTHCGTAWSGVPSNWKDPEKD